MADEFLTVESAAERRGCSVKWIYKLLAQGRLKHKRFGRIYQIYASSVDAFEAGPVGRPPVQKAHVASKRAGRRTKQAHSNGFKS